MTGTTFAEFFCTATQGHEPYDWQALVAAEGLPDVHLVPTRHRLDRSGAGAGVAAQHLHVRLDSVCRFTGQRTEAQLTEECIRPPRLPFRSSESTVIACLLSVLQLQR